MLVFTAEQIRARAPMHRLIACMRDAFGAGYVAPPRVVLPVPGGSGNRLLLLMPAFDEQGGGIVKIATVFPDNRAQGLATIHASIVVLSATGSPVAILDGTTVTRLRTAATSALASQFLSREDSAHLVVVGTGALAPQLAAAHCVVRPIERISVWGRRPERARATAEAIGTLVGPDVESAASLSLEQAVAAADIVSCATSSPAPLLFGRWLRPGTFVDLTGSFSPTTREADDETVRQARIFVDTFEGALAEAGDLLDPLARGVIERKRIEGELADLVSGRVRGRARRDEITLFKSVGTAIEDLAAARMIICDQ